ncbi:MAG: RNA-guided endonuclease InsQ/TnpB family protein [Candidatus Sericytochromatia bacterium]
MMARKAYRFRLEPNGEQRRSLAQFAGARRWVWNQALVENKRRLIAGERTATYAEMCRWITAWRHDPATSWLADIHVHPLQQGVKDLARAIADFFRKAGDSAKKGFPRFKKRGDGDGFRYPMSVKVEMGPDGWGRVWLPKIGWVYYRASRPVEGAIAQVTIVHEGEHWFVSIQTEQQVAEPPQSELPVVGLDLGVARFATLSDGTVVEPIAAFSHARRQIARAQRRLARKVKGSRNRAKARRRLATLRRQERRRRQDFLHQASSLVARRYGLVVMEDLAVKSMSASAAGTVEAPGRNVKAKAGLNRSILDQGWYQFKVLLGYKLAERGGELVLVNPSFTSQRCAACSHTEAANRESQAVFTCRSCGHHEHADLNAARNILAAAGHAVQACGGIGREPPCEAGTHRETG